MDRPIDNPDSGQEPPAVSPSRRGRTRLYANAAEKQRAYRQRRAARLPNAREPQATQPAAPARRPRTGKELLDELRESGFVGAWKDRTDIGDSVEFARRVRERAQLRLDRDGGAGLWAELRGQAATPSDE